jgi:hypothetical protein
MGMFNYYAFGLNISSQIELPGIIETTGNNEPDVQIIMGNVNPLISGADVNVAFNYYVDYDDVYLFWDDIGTVNISNGNEIKVDVQNDINQIIPFLLGPVMAILLHQRGFLVLHGSSVKINDNAIAFIGHRGIGKSTTAINLYKNGYSLITDDILAIKFDEDGIPYINPGYPHVRLTKNSYNHIKDKTTILTPICTIVGKLFCDASNNFSSAPLKLKRIYLLETGEQINISNLNSQETLIDLIKHSTAHRIFKDADQANNLTQCANLINNVSIRELKIIHSFNNISELINLIENDFIN